jgi:Arc/MetJ-type ribon-helix-helix transcriptional regulator
MAKPVKMTFTLDPQTAERIDRTAQRLGVSKSGVVREAVREYAARAGRLSEAERLRLLEVFDAVVPRIPARPAAAVDRELAAVRRARRAGGRRTPERPAR